MSARVGRLSAVAVEKVTKRYGRQRALGGVSLTIGAGRLCALLGPNGAGKSTLVGIVAGLIRPTLGRVTFLRGGSDEHVDPCVARAAIGLLAHDAGVYGELDALENLRLFGALYDVPDPLARAQEVLAEVGLEPSAQTRPARTYSRGMMQRLSLARALLHRPDLLLLDEPFSGLDRRGTQKVSEILRLAKEEGRVILVVSHDLEALGGLCDHAAIVQRGVLVHETTRDPPFSHAELRDLYHRHTEGDATQNLKAS